MDNIVIIGAGLAGATAAHTLRKEGFDGGITLVGAEEHHPYIRPPLSKGFLAGNEDEESLLPYPVDSYAEKRIEFLPRETADQLDREAGAVRLASGKSLKYRQLLLATGATPRSLPIPGNDLPGVHYLRTLEDSKALREALVKSSDGQQGRRVVLVGSGWIGLEVAATARTLGAEVTVLGKDKIPLEGVLGAELGAVFLDRHRKAGVTFHPETSAAGITAANGRASGVVTDSGLELPADLVVIAVGVTPNTALADAAGLTIQNGILTDESMRTSDPRIFAAGDVANAFHPVLGEHQRSEHWANAINTGKVAAKAMLGKPAVLNHIPYFYTDQFDLGMEYSGYGPLARDAKVVVRGDTSAGEFIAFWVVPVSSEKGRVVAGMNVNVWDVQGAIKALIRQENEVNLQQLADLSVPLDSL